MYQTKCILIKVSEWFSYLDVVMNKMAVEVSETGEALNMFAGCRLSAIPPLLGSLLGWSSVALMSKCSLEEQTSIFPLLRKVIFFRSHCSTLST